MDAGAAGVQLTGPVSRASVSVSLVFIQVFKAPGSSTFGVSGWARPEFTVKESPGAGHRGSADSGPEPERQYYHSIPGV